MKKIVLLIVALFIVSIMAANADGIDLSGMTTEELYNLNISVIDEIASRGEDEKHCFFPGEYVVGDEIESGRFVFTCIRIVGSDGYGFLELREDPNDNNSTIDVEQLQEESMYSMKLSDGNLLKVDRVIVIATKTK